MTEEREALLNELWPQIVEPDGELPPAASKAIDGALIEAYERGRKSASYDSRPETYQHIDRVRLLMLKATFDLLERAHVHDASKLLDPERAVFDEFTPKLKDTVYGSPAYTSFLSQMQPALEHHYAANRHHPEHFEDGIRGMSLIDLVEMLCDWCAASERTKDGDVRASIETINQERFGYGDELKAVLLNTLEVLGA